MGISIMMTTMMLINDGDDDDDGVNFEPEQDDGISYNFLHRLPPSLPTARHWLDLSIKANSNKSKRWILVLLTSRVYSVTALSTSRLPSEE